MSKTESGGKEQFRIFMGHLVPGFSTYSRSRTVHDPCQLTWRILALTQRSRIRLILNRMANQFPSSASDRCFASRAFPSQ